MERERENLNKKMKEKRGKLGKLGKLGKDILIICGHW